MVDAVTGVTSRRLDARAAFVDVRDTTGRVACRSPRYASSIAASDALGGRVAIRQRERRRAAAGDRAAERAASSAAAFASTKSGEQRRARRFGDAIVDGAAKQREVARTQNAATIAATAAACAIAVGAIDGRGQHGARVGGAELHAPDGRARRAVSAAPGVARCRADRSSGRARFRRGAPARGCRDVGRRRAPRRRARRAAARSSSSGEPSSALTATAPAIADAALPPWPPESGSPFSTRSATPTDRRAGAPKHLGGRDRRRVRARDRVGRSGWPASSMRTPGWSTTRRDDDVARTGDRAAENVESRTEVADAAGREGANACVGRGRSVRECVHDMRRDIVRVEMSRIVDRECDALNDRPSPKLDKISIA